MNKPYHIDGEPVSARELISAAEDLDTDFADDWFKQTSRAARILREHGHDVGENQEAPH